MRSYLKILVLYTFYISIFVLVGCLVIFGFLITLVYEKSSQSTKSSSRKITQAKEFIFDPSSKSSSFTTVTVFEDVFDGKDFLSYRDGEGRSNLLSKYGTKEYVCVGSCYCEHSERRSSTLTKKGVSYILAAVTTALAFKLATNHIQEICSKAEICEDGDVVSVVEDCKTLDEIEQENDEEFEKNRRYKCSGHCVMYEEYFNLALKRHENVNQNQITSARRSTEEICRTYSITSIIEFGEDFKKKKDIVIDEGIAKIKFEAENLGPFCENTVKESIREFYGFGSEYFEKDENTPEYLLPKGFKFPVDKREWMMCVSSNPPVENESIQCVRWNADDEFLSKNLYGSEVH